MKSNWKLLKAGLTALVLTALTACGGGGGGSSKSGDDNPDPTPDPVVSKSFSLSLASVKVQRLSNADEVKVDTSAVGSGELEYIP